MILAAWLLGIGVQGHQMHDMPGMVMPKAAPRKPAARAPVRKVPVRKMPGRNPPPRPAAAQPVPAIEHHDHAAMVADAAPAPGVPADPAAVETVASGTALPAGDAPAPALPEDHWADRSFPGGAMAAARATMMREGGGRTFLQVILNLAEIRADGGYRWDGEAWIGGDLNRATIKSEGSGEGGVEAAEVQALYSRAIGVYVDLQAGVRHDIVPSRSYLTLGVEGLAPYWFEVEAAAFLSDRGVISARLEGYYDQRITQRLVLQPRVEFNLSAQDFPRSGTGKGVVDAEVGLRLRYEIAREFAPYVGVSWERKIGGTARLARRAGNDTGGVRALAGVRFWF